MPTPLRVILADDHALVRAGIKSLLERLPDVTVVAEANDGREAAALVKTHQPDVVVMDLSMSGLNGFDGTARIVKDDPQTKVIILSMHAVEDYVLQALRAGAVGYLLKDAATDELANAFDALRHGETYLSPAIAKQVAEQHRLQASRTDATKGLTPRMREILQLIAEGKSTKEIAFLLNLSVKTIETHRMHLMGRLGIHDVAGLVRYAMRIGMISPET